MQLLHTLFCRYLGVVLMVSTVCLTHANAQNAPVSKIMGQISPSSASVSEGSQSAHKTDLIGWNTLTVAQQEFLLPIKSEWTGLNAHQQRRLLNLANRVQSLPNERKIRVQNNLVAWVKMTPEQRQLARENFQKIRSERAEKREKAWEWYSNLPNEHKQYMKDQAELVEKGQDSTQTPYVKPANPFGNALRP